MIRGVGRASQWLQKSRSELKCLVSPFESESMDAAEFGHKVADNPSAESSPATSRLQRIARPVALLRHVGCSEGTDQWGIDRSDVVSTRSMPRHVYSWKPTLR